MSVLVRHHTLLEQRGGAARVANLLAGALPDLGVESSRSFEVRERSPGEEAASRLAASEAAPEDAARGLPAEAVLHLHSTADWPAALASALRHVERGGRAALTLHDCALLTGGCPYPLECREWESGCQVACPRGYPGEPACQERREFLVRLRPLLICPSRWMATMAARALPGLDRLVVPNGVEPPACRLPRAEAKRSLGFLGEAGLALFVAHGGVGAAYKGGSSWRNLWRSIKGAAPRSAVCFIGGCEPGAAPSREAGDVFLWPYLERERLSLFMAAADVLVYPTLADNHPLVVLEAMRHGLPSVSWTVGGLPEQVTSQKTGLLSPPGDFAALARHAADLLNRPRLARQLGEAARALAETAFTIERMARDHVRAYERLTTS